MKNKRGKLGIQQTAPRLIIGNDNWELSVRICLHTIWPIEQNFVGGTERFLIDTAKALTRYGIDAFIVCSNTTPQTEIEGVKVCGFIPHNYILALRRFKNQPRDFVESELYGEQASLQSVAKINEYVQLQLANFDFDIVHLNTFSASLFDDLPRNAVLTIHENPEELDHFWHHGSFQKLAELILRGKRNLPAHTFAPSSHFAEKYSGLFGLRVRHNPIGVPWSNIGVLPTRTSKETKRILLPARFFPRQKGQDILIRALGELKRKRTDFSATLTGADARYGNEVKKCQYQIRKLNLQNFVSIKLTNSIEKEFFLHDVVVSPERYCSYGISVREAAAMGLKLVLSNIPPHKELTSDLLGVHYFETGSSEQCAEAINSALDQDPPKVTSTIRFRLQNDFDAFVKTYAESYLELTGKGT